MESYMQQVRELQLECMERSKPFLWLRSCPPVPERTRLGPWGVLIPARWHMPAVLLGQWMAQRAEDTVP
eukprot:13915452-Alexandrium_andersonii.AAC.1